MLQKMKKGKTPESEKIDVVTTIEEFEPDEYDGSQDGDDGVHHGTHKMLVSSDVVSKHEGEVNG